MTCRCYWLAHTVAPCGLLEVFHDMLMSLSMSKNGVHIRLI